MAIWQTSLYDAVAVILGSILDALESLVSQRVSALSKLDKEA